MVKAKALHRDAFFQIIAGRVINTHFILSQQNGVSNIIRRLMDNMKLLLICILRVLLSHSFIFFRFYFLSTYIWFYLFDNEIYVFLLLWLCILIVCLCMTTLTEGFPCFFLSCKANARVKSAKTGHGPHSSLFLCCSMYFCVLLCTVYFVTFSVLFVCISLLNYCHRVATQLQLNTSYHIISYRMGSDLDEEGLTHPLLSTRLPQAPCQQRSALK